MDYKEKYNAALERAKEYHDNGGAPLILEEIFPELKESEDEQSKKWILEYLYDGLRRTDEQFKDEFKAAIAWLERQKVTDEEIIFRPIVGTDIRIAAKQALEKIDIGKKVVLAFNGAYIPVNGKTVGEIDSEYDAWLEKQGKHKPYGQRKKCSDCQFNYAGECKGFCQMKRDEQKPVDKVEPKFKIGDWLQYRYAEPFLVEEITEQGYCNGNSCLPFEWEDEMHLWSITDAKDGDVLVASDDSIFLFAGVDDCACKYYVALTTDNCVEINKKEAGNGYWESSIGVHPATKEQRDLLFAKMKEAGYEWDADKKELKKIEDKTLDAAKVIAWLKTNVFDDSAYGIAMIEQFKKDCEI